MTPSLTLLCIRQLPDSVCGHVGAFPAVTPESSDSQPVEREKGEKEEGPRLRTEVLARKSGGDFNNSTSNQSIYLRNVTRNERRAFGVDFLAV